ncbi:hypothetical protein VNO77_14792 [Canavalia gladiata]|uniref:Uncharacterized protein n=1 Tax=Canavalia gladiata TaxID=3824 RepID=A0AAN9QNW1_CANGL
MGASDVCMGMGSNDCSGKENSCVEKSTWFGNLINSRKGFLTWIGYELLDSEGSDGCGELENGINEERENDKDGWDDLEPLDEIKLTPVLANIQAAQRWPVSQPVAQKKQASHASHYVTLSCTVFIIVIDIVLQFKVLLCIVHLVTKFSKCSSSAFSFWDMVKLTEYAPLVLASTLNLLGSHCLILVTFYPKYWMVDEAKEVRSRVIVGNKCDEAWFGGKKTCLALDSSSKQ